MKIFDLIKASWFFPNYCPEIKNWRHKMRGKTGKKNKLGRYTPLAFTSKDMLQITEGLKTMSEDLVKMTVAEMGERETTPLDIM